MLIIAKFWYLLRVRTSVHTNGDNDTSLLYGEISRSPLKTLEVILPTQYAPLVSDSNEWGRANHDQ